MTGRMQKLVLLLGSAAMVAAFLVQPKLADSGAFLGYFFFTERNVPIDPPQIYGEPLFPAYGLLALEFALVAFVTVCGFLAFRKPGSA